jgi:hypothetical protein
LEIEEFADDHADVFDDLPEQRWGDVTTAMIGDGGLPTVRVLKLAMGSPLTDQLEPMLPKQAHDFLGLENGIAAHRIRR